jgi:cytochrome d ubiquinol oxidase subunit II
VSLEVIVAGAMIVSLTFYALLGGADYGGGVWDLFARGPRAKEQRELIEHAIGPVWGANHIWLILVVVILFTAFPPAFAVISTALHIPLTLLLVGIVLRGAAFTFRTYDVQRDDVQRRWSYVFSVASTITPVLLGIVLGALGAGALLLFPSFFYLFRVFKGQTAFTPTGGAPGAVSNRVVKKESSSGAEYVKEES